MGGRQEPAALPAELSPWGRWCFLWTRLQWFPGAAVCSPINRMGLFLYLVGSGEALWLL